jgi:hypothetical protein
MTPMTTSPRPAAGPACRVSATPSPAAEFETYCPRHCPECNPEPEAA